MKCVAITGGIACGKSLVGRCLRKQGVPVVDADDLVHLALRKGRPLYGRVVDVFGKKVVGDDGEIDRKRLGRIVFSDRKRLNTLNRIIHPEVRLAWRKWIAEQRRASCRMAAVIVPLLFETGMDTGWDATVCVISSRERQAIRARRRGWARGELSRREAAQMSVAEKAVLADYVIVNNGTKASVREQVVEMTDSMLET